MPRVNKNTWHCFLSRICGRACQYKKVIYIHIDMVNKEMILIFLKMVFMQCGNYSQLALKMLILCCVPFLILYIHLYRCEEVRVF